jgi:two-component system alkaline phosphatase synthesis response regulator PhoP
MTGLTVLIVEDIPVVRKLLLRIAQQLLPASQVITANNGEEGFLRACIARPDLIITGLAMPQMNGFEMVRLLRREKIGNTALVIGLSGNDPHQSLTRAFRESCDEFLAKPFAPGELQAKIAKVLDRNHSQRTSFRQTDMFCGMLT